MCRARWGWRLCSRGWRGGGGWCRLWGEGEGGISEVVRGGGERGKWRLPLKMEGEGVSGVERRSRRRGEGMVGGMVGGGGGGFGGEGG